MANTALEAKRVTDLATMATAVATDVLPIVDDPTGTPATQQITVRGLFESNVAANVATKQTVSANLVSLRHVTAPTANDNVPAGAPAAGFAIWSDGSYIYVANTTVVKKAALSSIT